MFNANEAAIIILTEELVYKNINILNLKQTDEYYTSAFPFTTPKLNNRFV